MRSPRLPDHLELLLTEEPVLDVYAHGPWRVPDGLYERMRERAVAYNADPRAALLFLIPGSGTTLRANGRAYLETDPALLASFAVEGKPPRSVVVFQVESIYFQCARAVLRAGLWDQESRVPPESLPSPGRILAALSAERVGGEGYDREWPERARASMW